MPTSTRIPLRQLQVTGYVIISLGLFIPELATAAAGPKDNWTVQTTAIDATGSSSQNVAPYFDFQQDLYESLDYSSSSAANADLSAIGLGMDKDWIYLDVEMASLWSSDSQAVKLGIEFDVDNSDRGDFYLWMYMLSEFDDKEKWKDAEKEGDYKLAKDDNNDVGGDNPLAPDNGSSDGYNAGKGTKKDKVFARVMNNGSFQIAIKRDEIEAKDQDSIRVRVISAQSGSNIDEGKFTIHDQLPENDFGNIDSYPGADTNTWIPIIEIDENEIDLSVTQSVDEIYRREGDQVVITTTLSHIFGTKEAKKIEVELILPDGLTLLSVDEGIGDWDDKKDKWKLSSLHPGEEASFSLTATVDDGEKGNQIDIEATLKKVDKDDIDDSNNIAASLVYVVGWTGEISFVADLSGSPLDAAIPGADLFIQVTEPDNNVDDAAVESMTISLESSIARDSETLTLTETDAASGVFIGSFPTIVSSTPLVNDGVLQVTFDDTVTSTYNDELDSEFNFNTARSDTIIYEHSAPLITLVKFADKSSAIPGEVITYRVDYFNGGTGAATSLDVKELIPNHTNYVAGSMRAAALGEVYGNALPLTDANDGNEEQINGIDVGAHFDGSQVQISIANVDPDDGSSSSGTDSGTVYFQVQIQ